MFPLVTGLLAGVLAAAPVRHEAYVWQRGWTESVRTAVMEAPLPVTVLAAEVGRSSGGQVGASVVRVALDYGLLSRKREAVGLAIRVGSFGGPFDESSSPAALVKEVLAEARRAGLEPAEVQIDFDCAESKLAGYAAWMRAVRAAAAPTPVTITALPAWLDRPALGQLLEECDGYVLQVHSLEKPGRIDEPMTLCDPQRARQWISAASRLGRPFRVALPTYGYQVAFDAAGSFTGLAAEGGFLRRPESGSVRVLRSDAGAMAGLVRELAAAPPANLTGVIWYRLPVQGDALNWTWATLATVMRGQTPVADVKIAVRHDAGLYEIELTNDGDGDATGLPAMVVRWDRGSLVAADTFAGFQWGATRGRESMLVVARDVILRPGERRGVGWLRLSGEEGAVVDAHVELPR